MNEFGILTDVNLGMDFFQEYFDKLEWKGLNFNETKAGPYMFSSHFL